MTASFDQRVALGVGAQVDAAEDAVQLSRLDQSLEGIAGEVHVGGQGEVPGGSVDRRLLLILGLFAAAPT